MNKLIILLKEDYGFKDIIFSDSYTNTQIETTIHEFIESLSLLENLYHLSHYDMSLHGRLTIEFGTKAKSSFEAAYNYANKIIYLKKNKKDKHFSHEWFHALDHYIASIYGFYGNKYASQYWDDIPVYAMKSIHRYINMSGYLLKCKRIQRRRRYYLEPEEINARAFESCLYYLCPHDYFHLGPKKNKHNRKYIDAYPETGDIIHLTDLFDDLFKELIDKGILEGKNHVTRKGIQTCLF